MNCFRFADVMNNATKINTFNSDISSIPIIKTQHCQIMTTIASKIFIFYFMIKKPIMKSYTFFNVLLLGRSSALVISILS